MLFSKIKPLALLFAVLLGGVVFLPRASASVSLIFDVGGSSAISVAPGGTFSFDVFLAANPADMLMAYDFYLQASGVAGTDGYFTITDRLANLLDFPQLNTEDADVVYPAIGSILAPRNQSSLGATVYFDPIDPDPVPVNGSSLYYLGTLTFSVSPTAAPDFSTYFITSVSSPSGGGIGFWNDENFNEIDFASGGSFAITIIPEPTMLSLIAAGSLVFLRRRRR